jgi:aspartate carbamoyltransferase catalytic subunit
VITDQVANGVLVRMAVLRELVEARASTGKKKARS